MVKLPSIEQAHMSKCRCNCCKPKSVSESKEHAQVDSSLLLICWYIKLKLLVHNLRYVVYLTLGREQVGGENWELVCTIQVKTPVGYGHHHIDNQCVPRKNIHYGKEWAYEWAE